MMALMAAPPTTAPPPTTTTTPETTVPPTTLLTTTTTEAPTTTVAAGPPEFRATVRGSDQGPAYYGIFFGTTYGGGGGFAVLADCKPGTITVTVLDDGMSPPLPPAQFQVGMTVVTDLGTILDYTPIADGNVITGPVNSTVVIYVTSPSSHDVRIMYDCRG